MWRLAIRAYKHQRRAGNSAVTLALVPRVHTHRGYLNAALPLDDPRSSSGPTVKILRIVDRQQQCRLVCDGRLPIYHDLVDGGTREHFLVPSARA